MRIYTTVIKDMDNLYVFIYLNLF